MSTSAPVQSERLSPATMAGLLLVLVPLLLRAMATITPFPAWEFDPLTSWSPVVGLTPMMSMLCDAGVLLGASVMLLGSRQRPSRGFWLLALAMLAPCAVVIYHGWFAPWANINHQRLGAAWVSGFVAALALYHGARDRRVLAVVAGALAAFVAMLVVRGVVQMSVEHAALMADFRENKAVYLQAQGWAEGSPMARAYERRLVQNEATGWFGLSNVFASFMAAGLGVSLVMVVGALKDKAESSRRAIITFALLALASAGGLVMAGSKGGFAIGLMVVALAVVAWIAWTSAHPIVQSLVSRSWLIGPGLVLAALAAVIARGAVGDRIGELSVLFRWFYMQAATRIFAQAPFTGVGPDGFKDAYIQFKNPLSPEEITSPHSLFLDWASCLGLAGVGCSLAVLALAARAGKSLLTPPRASEAVDQRDVRPLVRLACTVIVLASLGAIASELGMLTSGNSSTAALTRISALVLGAIVVGVVSLEALRSRYTPAAVALGALALLVHTQIEVTGIWVQSCGLLLVVIASGAGALSRERHAAPSTGLATRAPLVTGALAALAAATLMWNALGPIRRWENTLVSSASELRPIADIPQLLRQASRTRDPALQREFINEAQAQLNAAAGRPIAMNDREINATLEQLTLSRVPIAFTELQSLEGHPFTDYRTWRERSRLAMLMATRTRGEGKAPSGENWLDAATEIPDVFSQRDRATGRASVYAWVGNVFGESARTLNRPSDWLKAEASYDTALRLDPYNLPVAQAMLRSIEAQGDPARIQAAAKRVLELNALQRLDAETRSLSPEERARVEGLANPRSGDPKQPPPKP